MRTLGNQTGRNHVGRNHLGLNHLGLALGIAVLLAAADSLGCPTCKDAVSTSDPDGLNLARGYFYSILLMLAMPFTLAGSFAAYVWREMRRQKRAAAVADSADRGDRVAS